jgi:hypothetical protein
MMTRYGCAFYDLRQRHVSSHCDMRIYISDIFQIFHQAYTVECKQLLVRATQRCPDLSAKTSSLTNSTILGKEYRLVDALHGESLQFQR